MKRWAILFILGAVFIVFISTDCYGSSSGGAPTAMCYECHQSPVSADIKIEGLPKKYIPEKTYTIVITVTSSVKSEGDNKGGFSVEVSGGELVVMDEKNTQISNSFLTQTAEGVKQRKWKIGWKAPEERKDITMGVSAIAANGDYSPNGDGFARAESTISGR
ncbi:MAG: choice-of-anchor V domain-containing protein [Nitrospirota bacterium]